MVAASAPEPPDVATQRRLPEALPAIDSLSATSDYRVFLRPEVPHGVQRDALRRLWSTVPALAPIEIAETHMGDFNDVPTFPDGLKDTIYDAVRGFVDRVTEPPAEAVSESGPVTAEAKPPEIDSPASDAVSGPDVDAHANDGSDPA